MREQKLLMILGISFIALIALIFLALFVAGAVIDRGPLPLRTGWRVSYHRLIYGITDPENNPKKLKALHQATKVRVKDAQGTRYTYDYTEEHRGIIQADSARCIACHGTMVKRNAVKAKGDEVGEKSLHQAMLGSPVLNFYCTDCHKEVDTRKHNPTHVTIKVDRKVCTDLPCHNAPVMAQHGKDKKSGKKWIKKHPKIAMTIGVDKCRQCHQIKELDFCMECHTRPQSHLREYPVQTVYPYSKLKTKVGWKGTHFVFAREILAKKGVKNISPRTLKLKDLNKMPCAACHKVEEWCFRCHIKHASNWLDPIKGHPARVTNEGADYCLKCHEQAKCENCHTYEAKQGLEKWGSEF